MMTNLRGFGNRTGQKAKQMTKQAKAPTLQAPKINKRSHRLTRSGIPRSAVRRQESPMLKSRIRWKMRDGKRQKSMFMCRQMRHCYVKSRHMSCIAGG